MNNIIERVWNQGSMVTIEDLSGATFQAESGGHTFRIRGVDKDGNALTLSGTPSGVMLRADGQDVTLTCSVSGGVVTATLPANAYSVPGRFGITIFLTSDSQKTALYAAIGSVVKTSSGTVAPPAGSDVVDLINQINTAIAAIPVNYNASFAPAYSTSGLYSVGQYVTYDGNLYRCISTISSGESWTSSHWTQVALANEVCDLKSAISLVTEHTKNIIEGIIQSSTISSVKGKILTGASYSVYNLWYAKVTSGTKYTISVNGYSEIAVYAAFYSDVPSTGAEAYDQQRLSNYGSTFTAPMNGYVAIALNSIQTKVQIEVGESATAYIESAESAIDVIGRKDISICDRVLNDISEEIALPISDYTVNDKHFMNSDGTESAESSSWEYVEVDATPGEIYSVTTSAFGHAAYYLLLDNNDNVIGISIRTESTLTEKTLKVEIPANCEKLIVNHYKETDLAIALQKYICITGNDNDTNILHGKVLCAVGDSITYGDDMDEGGFDPVPAVEFWQWQGDYHAQYDGTWTQQTANVRKTWGYDIAKRNHMIFYNGGVNGSTMQGLDSKYGFSLANGRYTKLPETIDYLLIWFGWNDTTYGTLGEITDTTNESYYGGYNVVLPYLLNKYPYAKIGLIVPYGTDAGHREAIRLLGNKWGVAVWDNYQGGTPLYFGKEDSVGVEASVVSANRAKYQAAGAHPNHYGHQQLSNMIEAWLKGI